MRPLAAVDVGIPVKPVQGRHGQHPWQGGDPPPQRPHVTESPRVKPVGTASQRQRLVGPLGGASTRAAWPAGVPRRGFGPRVQAITALCTGAYPLCKRTTQTVLEDLLGVSMGLGTGANLEQAMVQAVVEPVPEARPDVQAQPAASLEETGWREGRPRTWRWTAVTAGVTVVVVRRSRGARVAQALLGAPCWGGWVTERWRAYSGSLGWRRPVPRAWGGAAHPGPPEVSRVASGPRWDAGARPC